VTMRYVRFQRPGENTVSTGWLDGDRVGLIEGPLFGAHRRLPVGPSQSTVQFLAPVLPGKIIGVGRNYADHAREHEEEVPEIPLLFLKAPSALIGPGDPIRLPVQSKQVEHEAELAVVIGKKAHGIAADETRGYILGYTAANDVTARDLQRSDGQWARSKSFDTFCPLGPWIDTEVDPTDLRIICRVNGQLRQMSSTREMVFSVPQLLAYISGVMTLEPGDVILTGTPAGVGRLDAGDSVQVEIEGLGILENPVSGPDAETMAMEHPNLGE
jgi:2-keto-4-pentenoate hydratase/2-oxohepta-3-ene-1,7-dioic acid hydratase in catechol pathway